MRLLLLSMLVSCGCCSYMSDHRRLLDYLLRSNEGEYDANARPVREQNTTMDISLELHLNAVMDVDVKKGIMKSNGWVGFSWMDEYTTWEPADFGGIMELRVPASMFWVPDVYLFNDASGEYHASVLQNDVKVWKSSDGSSHWYTPTMFRSLCDVVTKDAVNVSCPLIFGSWMFHERYVNLVLKKEQPKDVPPYWTFAWTLLSNGTMVRKRKNYQVSETERAKYEYDRDWQLVPKQVSKDNADLSNFNGNSEWHLLEAPATRHTKVYDCCPEPYVDITWDIILTKRHHEDDDHNDDDDDHSHEEDGDDKNDNDDDKN